MKKGRVEVWVNVRVAKNQTLMVPRSLARALFFRVTSWEIVLLLFGTAVIAGCAAAIPP